MEERHLTTPLPPSSPPPTAASTAGESPPHHSPIRTYGRRAQRMTDAQRHSYANRHTCPWYVGGAPKINALCALLDEDARRPVSQPLILELGCGMGTATVEYARRNATHTIVAIDLYYAGIARIVSEINRHRLRNLYIVEGDGLELLPLLFSLPPALSVPPLSGVHIFFPDPWPKKKHRKRRMVGEELMRTLINLLQPGGHLSFVSDHHDYAEEVARCAARLPLTPMYAQGAVVTAEVMKAGAGRRSRATTSAQTSSLLPATDSALLCDARPRWRPETEFERKARKDGRAVWEGHWRRKAV